MLASCFPSILWQKILFSALEYFDIFKVVVDAFTLKHWPFLCLIHHKKSDTGEILRLLSDLPKHSVNGWRLLILLGNGSKVLIDLCLIQGLELGVVLGHNSHLKLCLIIVFNNVQ